MTSITCKTIIPAEERAIGAQDPVLLQRTGDTQSYLLLERPVVQLDPLCQNTTHRGQRRARLWQPCSPVLAAGLIDHVWTAKELLTTVAAHGSIK